MSDMEGTPSEERSTARNHKQLSAEKADVSTVVSPPTASNSSLPQSCSREHVTNPKSKTPTSVSPARTSSLNSELVESTKMPSTTPSHPVTAISSSTNTAQHTPNPPDSTGASPYGTRSRNRTGNARPNYAEDRENEMDYEYTSIKKNPSSTAASSTQNTDVDKTPTTHGRRSAVNGTTAVKAAGTATPTTKEQIPGTSSFSVVAENGSQSQSRKRKAPGGGTASVAASTPTASSTHTRRTTNPAPIISRETRDTNMVSFENSQRLLSDGQLVADDKTHFKVNGKCLP